MARGDHIRVFRGTYWHHGIDIGGGRVIHYTGEVFAKANASIRVDSLATFAQGGGIEVVRRARAGRVEHVVARAYRRVGERAYDVVTNNCEHFATWCMSRQSRSSQSETARSAVRAAVGLPAVHRGGEPSARSLASSRSSRTRATNDSRRHARAAVSDGVIAGVVAGVVTGGQAALAGRGAPHAAAHAARAAAAASARSLARTGAEAALHRGIAATAGKATSRAIVRAGTDAAMRRATAQGAGAVFKTAMKGNVVGAAAGLFVEQAVDTARWASGDISDSEYRRRTTRNVASSAGGLGGSAAGAALGTALCPGIGTAIGGIIGGIAGSLGLASLFD